MKKFQFAYKEEIAPGIEGYRIRALVDIPLHDIEAGDLGGVVQKESNLSHNGDCWIKGNARVIGESVVEGNALVTNRAVVKGKSRIASNAVVEDFAELDCVSLMGSDIWISGKANIRFTIIHASDVAIKNQAKLENCILMGSNIQVLNNASLKKVSVNEKSKNLLFKDNMRISNSLTKGTIRGEDMVFSGEAELLEMAGIMGMDIYVGDHVTLKGGVRLEGRDIHLSGAASVEGKVKLCIGVKLSDCVHIHHHGLGMVDLQSVEMGGDGSFPADRLMDDLAF